MPQSFALGCSYRNTQLDENVTPLQKFERIRDTGVFDYIDWLPRPEVLDDCIAASEKTGIPMLTGTWFYTLGRDEARIEQDLRNAKRAGLKMLNMMIFTKHADGHEVTDAEVVEAYLRVWELGEKLGVQPTFEVHVDCWSEKYPAVKRVVDQVRATGTTFNLTLDYSHVVFKIENPEQQDVSGVREAVERGEMILDPFEPNSLCEQWLATNAVVFAQFRPVAPNNPPNIWAKNPDGSTTRGIQYPFFKPAPGEWHSPWYAYKLAACKEALRTILRYHLTHPESPLQFITTEMITVEDYGMNAKYSVWEHNLAAGRFIRDSWKQMTAMQAANIPLKV
jgi:hypothetical protein